ncbi:MAG TPA: hypothetical protein VFN77_10115, partial [Acetobacteraceae bacterium]|nr:hypothetical protein [Acetobacteraceae bacterium]
NQFNQQNNLPLVSVNGNPGQHRISIFLRNRHGQAVCKMIIDAGAQVLLYVGLRDYADEAGNAINILRNWVAERLNELQPLNLNINEVTPVATPNSLQAHIPGIGGLTPENYISLGRIVIEEMRAFARQPQGV